MKCNKAPGTDGLTKECYAFFWNQIKDWLIESYNFSFKEHLRASKLRTKTRNDKTIVKKDTSSLNNWRPFSLLNVYAKILTVLLGCDKGCKMAFDKLNWNFIDPSLESFKLGDNKRRWIPVIYNNIESCTNNNG